MHLALLDRSDVPKDILLRIAEQSQSRPGEIAAERLMRGDFLEWISGNLSDESQVLRNEKSALAGQHYAGLNEIAKNEEHHGSRNNASL